MGLQRVAVVHPPLSVARDFIDYPYCADLGAVSAAAALRADPRRAVTLVNAFALPNARLSWRVDDRAHLGAGVDETLDALATQGPYDAVVVALTPFHRPPRPR